MKDLSRRDFGKSVTVGALGGLAVSSAAQLAQAQGSSAQSPKRMTTVLREMIDKPGVIAAPGIYGRHYRSDCGTGWISGSRPAWQRARVCDLYDGTESHSDRYGRATRSIADAVNIPVVVDVGLDSASRLMSYTWSTCLKKRGPQAFTLEDQIYPKRFHYHTGQEHTIELEPWLA